MMKSFVYGLGLAFMFSLGMLYAVVFIPQPTITKVRWKFWEAPETRTGIEIIRSERRYFPGQSCAHTPDLNKYFRWRYWVQPIHKPRDWYPSKNEWLDGEIRLEFEDMFPDDPNDCA
jgi:hypothetical protein